MNGFSAVLGVLRAFNRNGKRRNRRDGHRATRPLHLRSLQLEPLEDRTLLSAVGLNATALNAAALNAALNGTAVCYHTTPVPLSSSFVRAALSAAHRGSATPATVSHSTPPYDPSQIKTAYGISSIAGDGTGQTVAIVDAYDDPNIASELAYFDSSFGLPAANLTVVKQTGVKYNSGWATEIALDVEWVHAIAPGASIVLVEAKSSSTNYLYQAVSTASHTSGVSVVTMSWGGSESSGESSTDSNYFQVGGVTFLASTGDSGSPGGYPADSPDVIAVGGTTLTIDSNSSAWVSETGWSGSGGGTSSYESEPSYQTSVQSTGHRTIPDVSFDANPSTGVMVYIMSQSGSSGAWSGAWYTVGGTSVASPCWAGIIAITNQLRVASGLSVLNASSPTQAQTLLYALYASNPGSFHDINSSPQVSNGSFSTGPGYDEVTGLGSPVANLLVPNLVGVVKSAPPGSPTLISSYDTGASSSDNITYYNNSNLSNVLGFTVTGTISGATVAIYADGTAIGSATATGATTVVTTSGTYTLADGTHAITAKQTAPGKSQSIASSPLTITIDTTPPTVVGLTPSVATVADANAGTAGFSLTVVFSEAMNGALPPTISFPVENPSGTLTFNATASGWSGSTTYVARFDVLDTNTAVSNIDVQVSGGKDLAGNTQTQKTSANLFSIDTVNPTVTINQAAGQADPTPTPLINYTAVFSETVVDFTASDVTLSGTAGGTLVTAVTNPSGDQKTYNVAVSGMTSAGTVTASIAAGAAHDAVGNANVASTSTDNTVTYATNTVTVVGTAINDGNAQRSMVDSVTVTFSKVVNIDPGAFDVEKTDTGGGPVAVGIATQVVGGKTLATLTFSGSLAQFGSLVDGAYQLTVYGALVHDAVTGLNLDGDNDGQPGGNYVFGAQAADHFFRKFGDYNGDGLVNSLDLAQFKLAYLNPANYQWYFDFDADGDVDSLDFFQFKQRYMT